MIAAKTLVVATIAAGCFLLALLTGCGSDECQFDSDCPDGLECVSGGGALSSGNMCLEGPITNETPGNTNTGEQGDTGPPEGDPCDGITCSGLGSCVVTAEGASCICNEGFVEGPGLTCENPCAGETCSGFGTCEVLATGEARCRCDDGYSPDGDLSCVDNCDGIDCSGNGQCKLQSTGAAFCDCDPHYRPTSDGLDCEEQPDEPCAGIDCSGHGECVAEDGDIFCECDEGYQATEIGLDCEEPPADLCEDVDCSQLGSCDDSTGEAVCDCEANYVDPGSGPADCVHRCTNGELDYCDIWRVEGVGPNIQWEGYRRDVPASELPAGAEPGETGPTAPIKAAYGIENLDYGIVVTGDGLYKFDLTEIDESPTWLGSRPLTDISASLDSAERILGGYNIPNDHLSGSPPNEYDQIVIMGYQSSQPPESQLRLWIYDYQHSSGEYELLADFDDKAHDDWIGEEHAPTVGDVEALWLDVNADQDPADSWVDEELFCEEESEPMEFIAYTGVLTAANVYLGVISNCPTDGFVPPVSHGDFSPFAHQDAPPIDEVGAVIFHQEALYLFREHPL